MPNGQVPSYEPQQPYDYDLMASYNPQPVRPAQLTRDNFNSYVQSGRDCLVEFYADWCGACRLFEPQFEALAAQLAPRDVTCGRVNIETERDLASQYGVVSVPSLMLVRNDTIHHYNDVNNIAGGPVLEWVEGIVTQPPPVIVTWRPTVQTTTRRTTAPTTVAPPTTAVPENVTTEEPKCLRVCTREYE